jgi:hypothetical protein
MATDEEVKETVMDGLNGLAADFHDKGIFTLVQHPDKCLKCSRNYVAI